MPSAGRRKGVQSIEIGQRVLQALASGPGTVPLGEVARLSGMSPSKAHAYLVSFIRAEMVVQDLPSGHYSLGPAAVRLGLAAIAQTDVIAAARAAARRLVEETGETAFLAVWGNHGPTVVHRTDGTTLAPLDIKVGTVMPALTTSTGRVFVAFLPRATTAAVVERELAYQETTASRGRTVGYDWDLIDKVRQRGIARVAGMFSSGLVGLSAPVLDHEGAAALVVTAIGHMSAFDAGFDGAVARALMAATRKLSQDLGFGAAEQGG